MAAWDEAQVGDIVRRHEGWNGSLLPMLHDNAGSDEDLRSARCGRPGGRGRQGCRGDRRRDYRAHGGWRGLERGKSLGAAGTLEEVNENKLVSMANHIGRFFVPQKQEEPVARRTGAQAVRRLKAGAWRA